MGPGAVGIGTIDVYDACRACLENYMIDLENAGAQVSGPGPPRLCDPSL